MYVMYDRDSDGSLLGPRDRICQNCQRRFRVIQQQLPGYYCSRPCYLEHRKKLHHERLYAQSTDKISHIRANVYALVRNEDVSDIDAAVDAIVSKQHDDELSEVMERLSAIEEQLERLWEIVSNE